MTHTRILTLYYIILHYTDRQKIQLIFTNLEYYLEIVFKFYNMISFTFCDFKLCHKCASTLYKLNFINFYFFL